MNIIRNTVAATSALVLSLGLALPAAALNVNGTVDSTTRGTVDVGTVRVGADADIDVKVDASVKASDNSTSNSSDVEVQAGDVNGDGTADITGDPDFDLLRITRIDLDAGTVESNSVTSANVKTRADLSGFVAAQMKSDNNISAVESASDSVAVTYKQKARLFGFIPVTVNATANVDASGNVTLSFPWYAFLMATNKADLEANIQNRVDAALDANANANANATVGKNGVVSGNASATGTAQANANAAAQATAKLSAAAQAKVIAAVKAAMQAELNAKANASANANTQ